MAKNKTSPFDLQQVFLMREPYEQTRWEVRLNGEFLGYATSYYYDGRVHWFAEIPARKIRAEVRSRQMAVDTLYASMAERYMAAFAGGVQGEAV